MNRLLAKQKMQEALPLDEFAKSRKIWDEGGEVASGIYYCNHFPQHWKEHGDHQFMIQWDNKNYHCDEPYWKVYSRDSKLHPLIRTGKEASYDRDRGMSVFNYYPDALECAQISLQASKDSLVAQL